MIVSGKPLHPQSGKQVSANRSYKGGHNDSWHWPFLLELLREKNYSGPHRIMSVKMWFNLNGNRKP